jgi:hypothetical protein
LLNHPVQSRIVRFRPDGSAHAAKRIDQLRMPREDTALQGVELFPCHCADVQRVSRLLVHGLLQLAAADQLDVRHGRPRRLSGVLVLKAAAEGGQYGREIVVKGGRRSVVVERARRPLSGGYGGGVVRRLQLEHPVRRADTAVYPVA